MFKRFVFILVLASNLTGLSANAKDLPAATSKRLSEALGSEPEFFARVGSKARPQPIFGAVLRCTRPLDTGVENEGADCEAEVIDNSTMTMEIENEVLVRELVEFFKKNDEFFGGSTQGWAGYGAEVHCSTSSCKANEIELTED